MSHVHRCKGCDQLIPNGDITARRARKLGQFLYCGQCASLLREPDALLQPAGRKGNMLDQLEDPSEPRLNFKPERSSPRVPDDQSPTRRQQPVAATAAATAPSSFEVVEEYEIMGALSESAKEIDLDLEDMVDEPDADDAEGSDEAGQAAPSSRRASARRRGGASARSSGNAGGAGRGASRRNVKPAAGRGATRNNIKPASRSSNRGKAGAGSSTSKREVFYRSGSQRNAAHVNEEHENAVDSNVLQAVENKKARRARPSARMNSSRARQQPAAPSNRMSRRGGGGGGGGRGAPKDNSTTYIVAGVAGLILIIGLAMAFSGTTNRKGSTREATEEAYQSTAYYVQRARELQQKGDNIAASDMYTKAAEAAERAGNSSDAERWSQAAYGLKKHSVLHMKH